MKTNQDYRLSRDINPLQIIHEEGDILIRAFRYVVKHNKSNNAPYHHLNHMLRVMGYCEEGCKYHKIEGKPRVNLLVAALFHDFNHSQGEHDDEWNIKEAKKGVRDWYSNNPLNQTNINLKKVLEIIDATQYPYIIESDDLTLEQSIIRDADLMISQDSDWMGNMIVGLSQEMGVDDFMKMTDGQHRFHKSIKMCSPWGKLVYEKEWSRTFTNLDILRKIL
jgi:hypothetical protein